ncbi:amidohydrolase family protein [Candidatus Sumerlaeota bacterium]|nr:amidohydrolase family protein [Candidatus Sumerlaeota bacterium]
MGTEFEVWDIHCHLSGVPGQTPEERLKRLIEYADRLGIARLCVFMGMAWSYDPTPERIRQDNDEVLRALRKFPDRAFGFVYLNPKHTQASLDEINRCVRDGPMVGVKLWVAVHCNSPKLDPIVERAAQLNIPILQHTWLKITGNLPGESTPFDLAELAARHPDATLICSHSGGDWERGFRAIRPHKNIFPDLCGGDPTAGVTEMAVRELGAERVLYGSDVGGRSYASQLAKVFGADIPARSKRLILSENLKRLLRPILQEKGIRL